MIDSFVKIDQWLSIDRKFSAMVRHFIMKISCDRHLTCVFDACEYHGIICPGEWNGCYG